MSWLICILLPVGLKSSSAHLKVHFFENPWRSWEVKCHTFAANNILTLSLNLEIFSFNCFFKLEYPEDCCFNIGHPVPYQKRKIYVDEKRCRHAPFCTCDFSCMKYSDLYFEIRKFFFSKLFLSKTTCRIATILRSFQSA